MDPWQEIQIQASLTAQSDIEFFEILSRAAVSLGFEKCAYGMRIPFPISQPKIILLNNYPESWQESYIRNNYWEIDPTVAHCMKSVMPIIWSDELFSSCRSFWEEARTHGLRVGWTQSCFDSRRVGGLLTLARSCKEISHSELASNSLKMSWLAQLAHERLSRFYMQKHMPEASITLTQREIEVMRWTADGKTASEIGEIMNISFGTVNFHINNAVAKLGMANKTAAAIKAILLNLV